jgi:hypothetical protein
MVVVEVAVGVEKPPIGDNRADIEKAYLPAACRDILKR